MRPKDETGCLFYIWLIVILTILGCSESHTSVTPSPLSVTTQPLLPVAFSIATQLATTTLSPQHLANAVATATVTPLPILPEPTQPPTVPLSLPPTSTPCGPFPNWISYVVQANDTLYNLAINTNTTVELIKQANCLPGTIIYVDQNLYLPFIPVNLTPTLSSVQLEATASPTTVLSPLPQASIPTATAKPTRNPTATPTVLSPPSPTPSVTPPLTATASPTALLPPPPSPGCQELEINPAVGVVGTVHEIRFKNFRSGEEIIFERTLQTTGEVTFMTQTSADETGQGVIQFTSQIGDSFGEYEVKGWGILGTLACGKLEIKE